MRPLSILRAIVGLVGASTLLACPSANGPGGGVGATLAKAPDSGTVDRVGLVDGALSPDGANDLSFAVEVDGPVVAVFILGVGDDGKPNGGFHADTLIGGDSTPDALGSKAGAGTWGLAVYENDKLANRPDGTLEPLADGHHKLVLYLSPSSALTAEKKLRVWVLRSDDALLSSPALAI
ncbi:MAG: hypothetical protein ABI175_06295 [Polyangiales bacterium]